MKRYLSFVLVLIILFSLCACGSKSESSPPKTNIVLSNNSNGSPSKDSIHLDISNEISIIPNIQLKDISIVKSLTEENHYKGTLLVTAETVYADWQMECNVLYTKYDQGWMLDEIDWNKKTVTQTRYPDDATIIEYASNTLSNHEEYANTYYTDYMLPMYNPVVEIIEELNAIKLCWNAKEFEKHDYISHLFTSYWIYNPEIDNWSLIEDIEKENEEYDLSFERIGLVPGDYDFTGEWTQELSSFEKEIGIANRIIIKDFSWEKLEAYIPDLEAHISIDPHFYFIGEEFGVLKFENSNNQTINFQFGKEWTNVYFCVPEYDIAQATARIYVDLPPLS